MKILKEESECKKNVKKRELVYQIWITHLLIWLDNKWGCECFLIHN